MVGLFAGAAFAADTIKIGLLVPVTGFAAADGFSALESAKLAVEKVNGSGGVLGKQVELVVTVQWAEIRKRIKQRRVDYGKIFSGWKNNY